MSLSSWPHLKENLSIFIQIYFNIVFLCILIIVTKYIYCVKFNCICFFFRCNKSFLFHEKIKQVKIYISNVCINICQWIHAILYVYTFLSPVLSDLNVILYYYQVCCGLDHTLVLTTDGNVYSCGLGADGQTGKITIVLYTLIYVMNLFNFTMVDLYDKSKLYMLFG